MSYRTFTSSVTHRFPYQAMLRLREQMDRERSGCECEVGRLVSHDYPYHSYGFVIHLCPAHSHEGS